MTYSIVARCPESGQLGVAVQSHWLAVGATSPWIRAGAGVVTTQATVEIGYGPRLIQVMGAGVNAPEALRGVVDEDANNFVRQVAAVDTSGKTGAYTGSDCIAYAGHIPLEGAVVLANMMAAEGVPEAMATSYEESKGERLADRLLAALEAAQSAGGDLRGQQSAAIKVTDDVPGKSWWEQKMIDVRIDDHPRPLAEMRRLLRASEAYIHADEGDEYAALGDIDEAELRYQQARRLLPHSAEMALWHGVMLANRGRIREAQMALRRAYDAGSEWRELVRRLPAAGMLKVDEATLDLLLERRS